MAARKQPFDEPEAHELDTAISTGWHGEPRRCDQRYAQRCGCSSRCCGC
jgi:hypothetical protein